MKRVLKASAAEKAQDRQHDDDNDDENDEGEGAPPFNTTGRGRSSTELIDRLRAHEHQTDPLLVLDDEVCDWKGEAIEGGFRASFFKPGGVLVRECDHDEFVRREGAKRVRPIAFTGSDSPTRDSTSEVGAASASSSARSAASERASSAFVNQSHRRERADRAYGVDLFASLIRLGHEHALSLFRARSNVH
jgi:hypothetical protein